MIKDIAVASTVLIVTYFGFIHNIEVLQVLVGILYGIVTVLLTITLIFIYGTFSEATKMQGTLKDNYRLHNLLISIVVIPTTCYIYYISNSYNFLVVYILLCILAQIVRFRINQIVINRK